MKRFFSRLRRPLCDERGEITFFACFFVVGVVMLISFLLLYASVRITCINIRNGAKMELNNLSATIYADTYRSQRETNFEEYLRTLYSSNDYTEMLEATVSGGLAEKISLSTDDYEVSNISLEFNVVGDRVEYIFYCDVEFYADVQICKVCGMDEALRDVSHTPLPLAEWDAVKHGQLKKRAEKSTCYLVLSCTFSEVFKHTYKPPMQLIERPVSELA